MPRKFSMHLDDEAVLRIEQLQRRTKSANIADLFRLSLLVLDEQVTWLRAGGGMFVQASPGAPLRPYHPLVSGDDLVMPPAPTAAPVNLPTALNTGGDYTERTRNKRAAAI